MQVPSRLIIATGNNHKVDEFRRLFTTAGASVLAEVTIVSAAQEGANTDVAETELTFSGNALLKARHVFAQTGQPCLADDSGLCVSALGGAPGVFSARWSGTHGDSAAARKLLLAQLTHVAGPGRSAEFVCALAYVTADTELVVIGRCVGALALVESGENGFGYDSVFIPQGFSQTLADATAAAKDEVSHRRAAVAELAAAFNKDV